MSETRRQESGAAGQKCPLVLVVGGASSGKSLLAERCAAGLAERRLYVATMKVFDRESERRVAEHRARRGEGWQTAEACADLAGALNSCPEAGVVLVDSFGVWLAGMLAGVYEPAAGRAEDSSPEQAETEMDARESGLAERLDAFARALEERTRPVVVVSDEAGLGLVPADRLSRRFRDLLGRANRRLAGIADSVFFVSCGLPLRLKGEGSLL
ncbi:MAG: bifunctional adenosylcobinamide kinase/adenosylcobinamide-phosphate guanylyltransferase [Desulfovibrionaceae bacterium]|nr:bifunctional adenosylcobinamide kinase/adenosylcobinamide-phosphate guanylyltransferase [Desulfovibrionaceae bacterium]